MADIVQFEFGQPVEVALKFAEPKIYDGQYGERAMYTLTDGRVMYVDRLTAAKIKSLGVQPGEFFYVLKSKKGRLTEWSVFLEGQEPPAVAPKATLKRMPPPHVLANTLPDRVAARNASANLESKLAESIAAVEAGKAAAAEVPAAPPARMQPQTAAAVNGSKPRDRWTEVLLAQTNALTDVLAEALRHSAEHGGIVNSESVRSLLITSFIELSKRQERNRAA